MMVFKTVFWVAFAIVFYSFIGYGLLMYLLVKCKRLFRINIERTANYEPEVTLVVPCYNEADILEEKIHNTLQLDYPAGKLKVVFITDGSTDHSLQVLGKHPGVEVFHTGRRGGKTAAENRAMQYVTTPVVIFSDANTLLNGDAVRLIVRHFEDEKVGCVSGEKRIIVRGAEVASAAGEGMYWKYESFLKKLDSELYSAVGAAGELVAFRTELYEVMPEDTILDDFIQSMYIASKGYKIVYEPDAYAVETAAASVKEELKRKIRISAGGWQSIERLRTRLSFKKYPVLYFQYFSHRVLRWTVNPFLLILMFFTNLLLVINNPFFQGLFITQALFYLAVFVGYKLEARQLKVKAFFIPYYFCVMNYAVLMGLIRFLKGTQSGIWEKNVRMSANLS
jgi:biofilm PGA synthesis N-glycosyltransferase PgaC